MNTDSLFRHIVHLKKVLESAELTIGEIRNEIYNLENVMYDLEEKSYEYR